MGKKCSYYGKSMSTNFPESPPYDIIFLCYEKLTGKPMHFPYGEYTAGWESNCEKSSYYGKSMGTNFPGFPHSMGFTAFSMI